MPNILADLDSGLLAQLEIARICARPARSGAISRVVGLRFDVDGLDLPIGATVEVEDRGMRLTGEVVAVGDQTVTCMPLGQVKGLRVGARVHGADRPASIGVGHQLLGRVIDAMGHPIDDLGPIGGLTEVLIDADAPHPMRRARITSPMSLGIRAWDTTIPAARRTFPRHDGRRLVLPARMSRCPFQGRP